MTGSYNYKTYYLGTPKDIEESSSLILLSSRDYNISLDTLPDLKDVIDNSLVKIASRDYSENVFKVSFGEDIFDFDVIIYNNQVSGFIGYTIFSSLQHCYSSAGVPFKELNISLVFDRIKGDGNGFFIKLQTFLDPNIENTEIFGSTERWEYQDLSQIHPDKEEGYLKFTNRLPDYHEDKSLCIITESGVITHDTGVSGLYILSGVEIDFSSFTKIKPVLYKDDLAILKYSNQTGEYCVSSLSTLNAFGRPYDHVSGVIDKYIPEKLVDYSGQVLLFSDKEDYLVYSLETSESIKYPKMTGNHRNCVVLDEWDPKGTVRYISEPNLKKEISMSCPVPMRFNDDSYVYQEKIGRWWCFRVSSTGFTYISVYGIINSNSEIGFLNDRMGVYIEPGTGIYHFLPIDIGHSYESQGNRFLDKTIGEYSDIVIDSSKNLSLLPPELKCFLDGIRRKPIRLRGCLPGKNILGMGMGILFYLSEGLLYCY